MQQWVGHTWYEIVRFISHFTFTVASSLRIEGRGRVPKTGPVLVVANHSSGLDPVLVGMASSRQLHYLARKTLFEHPSFTWLIRSLNAVPIDLDGLGKEGLKTIIQQLKEQHAVLVFPEGTRTPDGNMSPIKPGVQLLVKRTPSMIVPVGIAGAFEAWPYWRKYPIPCPLFLPANSRAIAVSVGEPVSSEALAKLPKEEAKSVLFDMISNVKARAERLRRKP